jgi:hypothetical protein
MKRLFSLLTIATLSLQLNAQDASVKAIQATANTAIAPADTSYKPNKKGWVKGANFSANLTQIGNKNWIAAGGDKLSLSIVGSLNAFANRKWGRQSWDNVLDVNYGIIKTTSLGTRKINDRIDFITKYGYKPQRWNKVSWSILGQLRSQLSSGFEYDYKGTTERRRNSGFFAPAYITIAPGIDWKPNNWFSLSFSPLAARWTIASNAPYSYKGQGGVFNGMQETPLATLYGVDPAKGNLGQFGAFLTATANTMIFKTISYYGKADFYSNLIQRENKSSIDAIDVFWTNQFKAKIGKYFNVSYGLDLLYDQDILSIDPNKQGQSVGLQVLSTLGVGFNYKF